ncbi:hypothetical protein G7070_06385 [Propioniciclava coleopterorum]|uniref:Transcription factor zinc-finger domain-containing protein n=1 Tax=Propioniciclava coleopterorum TaxID=2714937 RepID=A0A6G7Y568_9ACTN|nr:hypothetical protein [Propioniciclava coleopterorum]QIK71960.1 hypothetical protein G7070_06385 [Propioniciclava coleopterorum]
MPARYLTTNPCEDACGTVETDRRVEDAPVYRCPGCDSEWIELGERTPPASRPTTAPRPAAERTADAPRRPAGPSGD